MSDEPAEVDESTADAEAEFWAWHLMDEREPVTIKDEGPRIETIDPSPYL